MTVGSANYKLGCERAESRDTKWCSHSEIQPSKPSKTLAKLNVISILYVFLPTYSNNLKSAVHINPVHKYLFPLSHKDSKLDTTKGM